MSKYAGKMFKHDWTFFNKKLKKKNLKNNIMSNKINEICHSILSVTDEEIQEMRSIIDGQKNYIHPFKSVTQKKQNNLGKENELVLNSVIETKTLLIAASPEKQ